MPRKQESSRGQEAGGLASMTLGERLVSVARLATEVHLQLDGDQRRNGQQAKRAADVKLGIGGAGPTGSRVMEDPALAPLTFSSAEPDQADSLRRLMRLRIRDAEPGGQAA